MEIGFYTHPNQLVSDPTFSTQASIEGFRLKCRVYLDCWEPDPYNLISEHVPFELVPYVVTFYQEAQQLLELLDSLCHSHAQRGDDLSELFFHQKRRICTRLLEQLKHFYTVWCLISSPDDGYWSDYAVLSEDEDD